MTETITFSGFVDWDPGWEFDMPVFLMEPFVWMRVAVNSSGVEYLVENLMIDFAIDGEFPESDSGGYNLEYLWDTYERAKDGDRDPGIGLWSVTVEYDPDEHAKDDPEWIYRVTEESLQGSTRVEGITTRIRTKAELSDGPVYFDWYVCDDHRKYVSIAVNEKILTERPSDKACEICTEN